VPKFDPASIRVLACDIFDTTVDWHTGVAGQITQIVSEHGQHLDAGAFADAWRDRYLPSLERVNRGERGWVYLDTLHRESLDELLDDHGIANAFDDDARRRLVHAWHRLPAWDDAAQGLTRLRRRFVVTALSNGGFALLTNLAKAAGLPFDCIVSAELARVYKPAPRPTSLLPSCSTSIRPESSWSPHIDGISTGVDALGCWATPGRGFPASVAPTPRLPLIPFSPTKPASQAVADHRAHIGHPAA
jgi:2-haloalkanoic acid dehalogenase type II